jgi:hypothetical protein
MTRLGVAILSVLVLVSGAGCPGRNSSRPLSAVDAYVDALRAGDFERAYDLMSERYRKEHTREEFVRMLKESPEEVSQTAARLASPNRQVEVAARFSYDDLRDELALVQEGGGWRIASDPLNFYPQDTPSRALRSFVRAVELKRYDIVLRFVPNKWREAMTPEKVKSQFEGDKREDVDQMMRLLVANLDNTIDQNADQARMQYGDRFEVIFVREEGVWKIEDPDGK